MSRRWVEVEAIGGLRGFARPLLDCSGRVVCRCGFAEKEKGTLSGGVAIHFAYAGDGKGCRSDVCISYEEMNIRSTNINILFLFGTL